MSYTNNTRGPMKYKKLERRFLRCLFWSEFRMLLWHATTTLGRWNWTVKDRGELVLGAIGSVICSGPAWAMVFSRWRNGRHEAAGASCVFFFFVRPGVFPPQSLLNTVVYASEMRIGLVAISTWAWIKSNWLRDTRTSCSLQGTPGYRIEGKDTVLYNQQR